MITEENYLTAPDIKTKLDSYIIRYRDAAYHLGLLNYFPNDNPDNMFASIVVLFDSLKSTFIKIFEEHIKAFTNVVVTGCSIDEDGYIVMSFTRNETYSEYKKRKEREEKEAQKKLETKMNKHEAEYEKLKKRYKHFLAEKEYFDNLKVKL